MCVAIKHATRHMFSALFPFILLFMGSFFHIDLICHKYIISFSNPPSPNCCTPGFLFHPLSSPKCLSCRIGYEFSVTPLEKTPALEMIMCKLLEGGGTSQKTNKPSWGCGGERRGGSILP